MTFLKPPTIRVPTPIIRGLLPLVSLTVVSLLGTVLMYAFGLRPAEERLQRAEQAYQTAKQTQADLQQTKTQQMRAQTAQRQLDRERKSLPTQDEFTPLAMALSELGKREHVVIPGMSYDIMKPEGTRPVKATIAFKASGDYAAIYRFLHRLETAESYLVIERLDVGSERRQQALSGRVAVSITVATYLRQASRVGTSS